MYPPASRLLTLLLAALLPCALNATPLITPPKDNHQYRSFELPNRLPVMVIHDPGATDAAASVTVATGYAADPADLQGLAHLTEHLVFLGSQAYPDPNGYSGFMGKVGGNYNATTAMDHTDYYFRVPARFLPEALDRLGATLAAPLLDPAYIDRERHAVDAEYHLRLDREGVRIREVVAASLNPAHPLSSFGVGNMDTLGGDPARLRQQVQGFLETRYSSLNMRLVLSGPQSLDELQAMAEKSFAGMPQRPVAAPPARVDLSAPGLLPATVEFKPIKPAQRLALVFPLNDQTPNNAEMALVTSLITDKAPGSLQAVLRKAGLARSVVLDWYVSRERQGMLSIGIDVGLDGKPELDRIQASVFAWLQLIRQDGLQSWRLRQDEQLSAQRFAELQPSQALELVRRITGNSRRHPEQDWLYGPYRRNVQDTRGAEALLAAMTPDNLLRVWISPHAETPLTSRWLNVPYGLKRVQRWPEAQPVTGLSLPPANPFIADDLHVLPVAEHPPRLLVDAPGLRVWHAPEQRFNAPRVSWRMSLRSPVADSAQEHVYRSLFTLWFKDHLQNTLRDARIAGLGGSFDLADRGFMLRLDGLRQRQPELLEHMLKGLAEDEIDAETFARVAARLREVWQPHNPSTPVDALQQAQRVALVPGNRLPAESLAALERTGPEQLRQWRWAWLKQLHVDALAVGNLQDSEAASVGQLLERRLHPGVPAEQVGFSTLRQLAADLPLMRARSSSHDSGLILHWPFAEKRLEHQADAMLLARLIGAPFYQSLRTEQQTGYLVNASPSAAWQSPALVLTVQSNAYRSDEIRRRSEVFLDGIEQRIAALDDSAMTKLRNAVTNGLDRPAKSASELIERHWADIVMGDRDFTTRQRLSGLVAQRSKAQLLEAWQALRQSPALWIAVDPGVASNLTEFRRTAQRLEWQDEKLGSAR